VTDTANQVLWRWDHAEPFGNSPENSNPSGLGTFSINYRFPGQYLDKASNTHYNMARDYDPATGRYPQFDPIGLRGGINGYAYVGGNPISKIDPMGLDNPGQGPYGPYWMRPGGGSPSGGAVLDPNCMALSVCAGLAVGALAPMRYWILSLPTGIIVGAIVGGNFCPLVDPPSPSLPQGPPRKGQHDPLFPQ
jgi:RHS repeat-associated protein